jgi:hypothetical protein
VVVDSSSIEVNRRARRAKSDRLDARKLVSMLLRYHTGERRVWSVLHVPTVADEDRRQLHRELRTLQKERTRVTNRVNGLLAAQGVRLPKGTALKGALATVRLWDGSALPAGLRARLERECEHAQFLRATIGQLERERQRAIAHGRGPALDKVRQLLRLRAIGPTGAWVYVNEFFGWRQFRNRKEVGAAAGLTPTPYQSGDARREQGISKAGSRHIRAVASGGGVELVAVSTAQPLEPVVSSPVRPRRNASAPGGHRRAGAQGVDRAVALSGVRRRARGSAAEAGVTRDGVEIRARWSDAVTGGLVGAARHSSGPDTRPDERRGAFPHELAEVRRRANAGWGDRSRVIGTDRRSSEASGPDGDQGELPASTQSGVVTLSKSTSFAPVSSGAGA